MTMRPLVLATLFAVSGIAAAETMHSVAMTQYQHLQDERTKAEHLSGAKASKADLQRAAKRLEDALVYAARPEVRERATGNAYLYYRGHDVRMDLASVYARLGDKDKALALLEQMQRFASIPPMAKTIGDDHAYDGMRTDPRFQKVMDAVAVAQKVWNGKAFETPFQDKLTVAERVAGLSLFWSEARHSFVHFAHVPDLDWDKTYLLYLDKVMAAETTRDYYRVLMQLAPLLKDGHTNIYPPQALADEFHSRPPFATALIEGKVLVTRVDSPTLARQLQPGDEIVAVDGMPVRDYAEQKVAPFASASTAQDRDVRLYTYQLLSGAAASPVRLRIRSAQQVERDETVARSGYTDTQRDSTGGVRMLDNGIAYIAIDQFEDDARVKAFEQAMPQIMRAKGLVIDVRDNGGGDGGFGLQILSYLTRNAIVSAASYEREGDAVNRARNGPLLSWKPVPADPLRLRRAQVYTGPVAVLTGPKTFSAGEDFVLSFDLMKRGKIIGRSTAGSTGQPLQFGLPGGGMARVCVKLDAYPDGRSFVGEGIRPDIEVVPTVADVRSGRDATLERALAELKR
jgi:C-terminal processing protease CtpA/Prc